MITKSIFFFILGSTKYTASSQLILYFTPGTTFKGLWPKQLRLLCAPPIQGGQKNPERHTSDNIGI